MDAPQIVRAKLIPMNGDRPDTDEATHIDVQFNPSTLRVTLANTLRPARGGGAGQYVDRSESSLAVELVFDTSVQASFGGGSAGSRTVAANTDVRTLTRRIADAFMQPQPTEGNGQPLAPRRCRIQWGSFQFTGMLASYGETLDFFAPEGIPLRATLALSFKEDRYQFDQNDQQAAARAQPTLGAGGPGQTAASATQAAGGNPLGWRLVADFNDLENPRFTAEAGVVLPGLGLGLGGGLSAGINGSAGSLNGSASVSFGGPA